MGSQCHHQTKVSLTNLKVHLKKKYWYISCGCRKTLITILLLVLVKKVPSHVKSFFIVFKTSNHISIYSNQIAQHNQFEHNINVQHVQICEIQNGDVRESHRISGMDLGNPCDVFVTYYYMMAIFSTLHGYPHKWVQMTKQHAQFETLSPCLKSDICRLFLRRFLMNLLLNSLTKCIGCNFSTE